ncbi:hypothetical protein ACQJBY_010001 [Aegilops geniculata]
MIRAASPRPPSAVQLRSCASSSSACPFRARGSGSRVAATGGRRRRNAISCCASDDREGARGAAPPAPAPTAPSDGSIQLYSQIEKVITEAAKQSNQGWSSTGDWTEIEVPFGGVGVEAQVLGALVCRSFHWWDFRRGRAAGHVPLLPRASRRQGSFGDRYTIC